GGGRALQAMVGVSMTRGWSTEVRNRLGGAKSCTHLKELLIPLATTAYQSMSGLRAADSPLADEGRQPAKIDSCYAYRADGEVVLKRWPQFHRAAREED